MNIEDPDELIPCPFDPVHMLQRKRMPYHIVKCRKNQPQKHFRVCPFNYRHVVHRNELDNHLKTCPDQGIVEREIIHRQNLSAGITPVQKGYTDVPVSSFVPPEPTEDWDTSHVIVEVGEYNTQSSGTESDSSLKSASGYRHRLLDTSHDKQGDEPPQPRPPMNSGPMNEVMQLSNEVPAPQFKSPPRGIGRGRGRGFSSVKSRASQYIPELALPPGVFSDWPPRVGRARGRPLYQAAAMAHEAFSDVSVEETAEELEQMELERKQKEDQEKELQEQKRELEEEAMRMRKRERKLKKMLRQIMELEEKASKGEDLDKDQLAKLSRKDDVLHELSRAQEHL